MHIYITIVYDMIRTNEISNRTMCFDGHFCISTCDFA